MKDSSFGKFLPFSKGPRPFAWGYSGFTLLEIMIVVAILSFLAAIAIPNFLRYRRTSQASLCVSNLAEIQTAIEQCRFAGRVPSEETLFGPEAYVKAKPVCPSGGVYVLPVADGEDVTCSYSGGDPSDKATWHQLIKP